jgi:hypothetical protein
MPDELAELADRFASAALAEGSEEFWTHVVVALTRRLDRAGDDPKTFTKKVGIAGYLLTTLLRNFYQGDAVSFFHDPGELRNTVYHLAQTLGLHILPVHFYSPVPAIGQLNPELWSRCSELPGLKMNDQEQLGLLRLFGSNLRQEYDQLPKQKPPGSPAHTFYLSNGYYESIDAEIYYSIIRHFKPRRIYEIGSGFTTYLAAQAIQVNHQEDDAYQCELVAMEPFPNPVLQRGFPGLSRLITAKAQDVPRTEFEKLEANDILFIDSSHVLKIGSDVQYEYLEILPRLKKGVMVHIHDVFLPMEYPEDWVLKRNRYWTEQYLLQAFLAFNSAFEVVLAGTYLHVKDPEELAATFKNYSKGQSWRPGYFWMRKTA